MNFGVYLLIKDHIVVYVGQTYDLEVRLKQHKNKDWDRYHFFECHPDSLNQFEERLIDKFRPKYNRSIHAPYSEHIRKLQLRREIKAIKYEIGKLEKKIALEEKYLES